MMINAVLASALMAHGVGESSSTATTEASPTKAKPNIIFILADDLGYGDLGCYGQSLIETPNIDQLARDGMRFTNHYSGQTVSAPSRCVLLTGLHTGHAYVRGNNEMPERGNVWSHAAMLKDSSLEGQMPLPAGTVTFPSLLQGAGYITACIGKWGLGYPGSEGEPNKMGFDFFYGYNCQRQAHTYYPPFLYRNTHREYLDNKLLPPGTLLDKGADPNDLASYSKYNQKQYAPDLMYDEILKFIDSSKDKPFMLMWTTNVPHVALQAPEKWVDHYVKKFGDEKPYLGESGYFPARYPRATYAAMISYFDEQIGDLIRELKAKGIYDNTIIVFTSDNGPSFAGGADSPWFDSAKPFKSEFGWGKTSLREGGIRVPLIVSWPNHIAPGSTSNHVSAFWDFLPTFAQIGGYDAPKNDGISMLPELKGQARKQKEHSYLYWEFPEGNGAKAVRMGKWKGIIENVRSGNKQVQLYNLEKDPKEQNNVASKFPKVVKKIEAIMKEAHTPPAVKSFEM